MSKHVSRGLALVLFTGGLTLLGAGIANAADTTGDDGLLSGTQIVAPITAPVEILGNAVSVVGDTLAAPAAAPVAVPVPAVPAPAPVPAQAPAPAAATSGSDSVLGGTQAVVDAAAPVTVQGNAISVLGDSAATPGAAPVVPVAEPTPPESAASTSGSDGVASGTQVVPDVAVPVTIGGNAISLLGDSSSTGTVSAPAVGSTGSSGSSGSTGSTGSSTSGSDGVASGTQVVPDVAVPVTVGGNAISLLGDSSSTGTVSAPAMGSTGSTGSSTSGSDGVASGTQVVPDVAVPVTVGGNAISLLGDSSSTGTVSAPAMGSSGSSGSTGSTGSSTSGSDGVASGTQVVPDVAVPVTVGGNAISILGDAASTGSATMSQQEGTSDGVTTTGNDGILAGTQIVPSIALPITIGGNAISVLGDTVVDDDGTTGTDGLPTDPADPTETTVPVTTTGATTAGTAVVAAGERAGTARAAALSTQLLASTGVEIAPLLGLVAVLLTLGLGLTFAARRRTS